MAYGNYWSETKTATTSTWTVQKPSGSSSSDVLIAIFDAYSSSATNTPLVPPTGWTQVLSSIFSGSFRKLNIFRAAGSVTDLQFASGDGTDLVGSVRVISFTGRSTSAPVSVVTTYDDVLTAKTTSTLTATAGDDLLVTWLQDNTSAYTSTPASGLTSIINGTDTVQAFHDAYVNNVGAGVTSAYTIQGQSYSVNYMAVIAIPASTGPTVSSITPPSPNANEGTSIVHTVNLSATTSGVTTFNASLANGTATSANYNTNVDQVTLSTGSISGGVITLGSGVSSFTVTVTTYNDSKYNDNLTYTLTVGGVASVGTINNTNAIPTHTVSSPASVARGSPVTFTITQSAVAGKNIDYTFSTADGTALAAVDYTARTAQTATITAGQTSTTVVVNTLP